jgi:hypothetical protein
MNGIEMPGDQNARLALFRMRETGADATGKTLPSGDAFDLRAMIDMSRAVMSSMRSTAPASQVGLSHSTQTRNPCSMASVSNGRLAGFMSVSLGYRVVRACRDAAKHRRFVYEIPWRRNCKAKHRTGYGAVSRSGNAANHD